MPRIIKRKPPKGMPLKLKRLWERGERVRFAGGWLGESEIDRTVAEWIDENHRAAWTHMKMLLYMNITKQIFTRDENHSGQFQPVSDQTLGEAANALAKMEY